MAKADRLLCDFLCDFVRAQGFELAGQAFNSKDALTQLKDRSPELLIVGADLGEIRGIDLAANVKQQNPGVRLILFSREKSANLIQAAEKLGIDGLLFADDGRSELGCCLEAVEAGRPYRSPQVAKLSGSVAVENYSLPLQNNPSLMKMSRTELKILWLVSHHLSVKEISEKLFISEHTVTNHQANIRQKAGLRGHGSLLKYALSVKARLIEVGGEVWPKPE